MSKVNALYHIVFCTKRRESTIPDEYQTDVYRFIWTQLRMCNCALYRIGGIANHIHMLIHLHPTARLSDVVRNIKANTSRWLMQDSRFPNFNGWSKEYYAMTVSPRHKEAVIRYISTQREHHAATELEIELISLCAESQLEYDPRDMTD